MPRDYLCPACGGAFGFDEAGRDACIYCEMGVDHGPGRPSGDIDRGKKRRKNRRKQMRRREKGQQIHRDRTEGP